MPRKIIQQEVAEYECDHCGKKMEYDAATVSFGYGSKHDEEIYYFCTDQCLRLWCEKNITMEKKEKST